MTRSSREASKFRTCATGHALPIEILGDFEQSCQASRNGYASFRHVGTCSDVAGTFIKVGDLHKDLFLKTGAELIFVWLRVDRMPADLRADGKDSRRLGKLEGAATGDARRWPSRAPKARETMKGVGCERGGSSTGCRACGFGPADSRHPNSRQSRFHCLHCTTPDGPSGTRQRHAPYGRGIRQFSENASG